MVTCRKQHSTTASEKLTGWRTELQILVLLVMGVLTSNPLLGQQWQVGFSKVDITPTEPLRLSGYATRNTPFTAVADPLAARAAAIHEVGRPDAATLVLVSVDSIAVTGLLTQEIATWAEETYQIPRAGLVLSSTHSHTAPQLHGGLNNIFREPLTPEQADATKRYTEFVATQIKQAIAAAMKARQPAKLSITSSTAGFAMQRRMIRESKWTGFGESPAGLVDHRVRVLQCRTADDQLLGAAFMYACHCTTLGPEFNQLSGDWAGLSASRLEQLYPQAVFLPVIGCGADANPSPRTGYEFAQQHAATMVDSVQAALKSEATPITDSAVAHFGYAGLAPEQPTTERIEQMAASSVANEQRWAEHMQATRAKMGRLPETVPMPIHTWQFGDELTWVFLGGEVVAEYQTAIAATLAAKETWVAAYCDDVFAYVASERMRDEGGYEVDSSMIYYLQPGRWQAGTQALIERRVREIRDETHAENQPLSAQDALAAVHVPEGYRVELVASEPLVQDPVNIAFSPDGSVWVVEMADYPLGNRGGGRVKQLRDTNGDGKLDHAHQFLSGLSYPTSVMPWRDGAIVVAAPEVFFARDTNGDGEADEREVLLRGIAPANPQHRANGFELGLDGWLHLSAGEGTKELESTRNSQKYEVAHDDFAWNPDTGEIRQASGQTQFVRARDDFGNWFGNSNSLPIFHYVVDLRYQHKATFPGDTKQHLLTPAVAPPVYPRSRTVDRFNDLFALNRFTSACSSMFCRVPGLGKEMYGAALVCEPVHNLVARFQVNAVGSSFIGSRFEEDKQFDFFTSTDPFCRPVRAVNGPDGTLWIVDMTRQVIEHPEWIPTAWQERLNVRSGEQLGRIYRVFHESYQPQPLRAIPVDPKELLFGLASDNAAIRELSLLQLMWNGVGNMADDLRRMSVEHRRPAVRIAVLGALAATHALKPADCIAAFADQDPRVVRMAIELSESMLAESSELQHAFVACADAKFHEHQVADPQVDLQWLLTSLQLPPELTASKLAAIAARSTDNPWIIRSLALCDNPDQAYQLSVGLLDATRMHAAVSSNVFSDMQQTLKRLWTKLSPEKQTALLSEHFTELTGNAALSPAQMLLVAAYTESNRAGKSPVSEDLLRQVTQNSVARMLDQEAPQAERMALINLLGCSLLSEDKAIDLIEQLIDARQMPVIQESALLAARRINSLAVAQMLIRTWPKLGYEARTVAAASLLTRRPWTEQLVAALESGAVKPVDLDASTIQQLQSNGDRKLRTRCETVFGKTTPRAAVVKQFLNTMPKDANADNGKRLFVENCATCHQPPEGKPMIGPPIENLKHWSQEQWVTAILDPNRNIEPKFHQYSLLTKDGAVLAGVIQSRSAQSVQLAGTDGNVREVPLSEIEELRDVGVSLMPEGLEAKLSPEQLAALIAHLRSR